MRNRVRAIEYGISGLHIKQIQLHGIPGINVLIREKETTTQQHRLRLIDALFTQRATHIDPVHCRSKNKV